MEFGLCFEFEFEFELDACNFHCEVRHLFINQRLFFIAKNQFIKNNFD